MQSTPATSSTPSTASTQSAPAASGPAFKRLAKEYQTFLTAPPPSVLSTTLPTNQLALWHVTIAGPPSTPYAGGHFTLTLSFPPTYPMKPPTVAYLTPIYHVNVDMRAGSSSGGSGGGGGGAVCQDVVCGGWSPTLRVADVVGRVVRMMEAPVVETPLDPEIGEMCVTRPDKYREIAQQWTKKHAMK